MSKLKRIKAPNGAYFKVGTSRICDDNFVIALFLTCNNKKIGYIVLEKIKNHKYYCTHATLDYEYRGHGLGVLMYAKAIQWCLDQGYGCRSSGASSENSKRVWRSKRLNQRFKIKSKQKNPESQAQTWFAYNK